MIVLPPSACVVSDPRGLRRPALGVCPSPHSPFPPRVSVRMRLAPLGSTEQRRGSRAAETRILQSCAFAWSAAAAGGGGKPGSPRRPLPAPVTGKPGGGGAWSHGGCGRSGTLVFGLGGFGFHSGCGERGGGRVSCLLRDPEANKDPFSLEK